MSRVPFKSCKKILPLAHIPITPTHAPSQNCSPACIEQIPEATPLTNDGQLKIELTATNQNSDSAQIVALEECTIQKICLRPGPMLSCKLWVRHDRGAKPTKTPWWPTASNVANKNASNKNSNTNNGNQKCHHFTVGEFSIWTSEGKHHISLHLHLPHFWDPDFQNVSVTNPPILWNAWDQQVVPQHQDPSAVEMFQVLLLYIIVIKGMCACEFYIYIYFVFWFWTAHTQKWWSVWSAILNSYSSSVKHHFSRLVGIWWLPCVEIITSYGTSTVLLEDLSVLNAVALKTPLFRVYYDCYPRYAWYTITYMLRKYI